MGMPARALLPSWFRRRREARDGYVPSPEEEREIARRRCAEQRKRQLEELRPRSHARRDRLHGDSNDLSQEQVLAREEAEKRKWIDEQKRLIADARQRAGGPDPRWDQEGRTPAVVLQDRLPAKPLFPPGGYNAAPVRETCAYRFGPGSDAAFLESVITGGKSGAWAAMCEAYSRRQRYLRDYCPFQRDQEEWLEEEESVSSSSSEESVSSSEEEEESVSEIGEESTRTNGQESDATGCSSR